MPNTYPARFSATIECLHDIPKPGRDARLACNWGDSQDCADDNTLRAEWAALAVKAFARRVGEDEIDTTISDLLCDLMHLCDALDLDFDDLVQRGRYHYEPELRGEF